MADLVPIAEVTACMDERRRTTNPRHPYGPLPPPAFVTSAVRNVLVETFGLDPITTPEEDLTAILS